MNLLEVPEALDQLEPPKCMKYIALNAIVDRQPSRVRIVEKIAWGRRRKWLRNVWDIPRSVFLTLTYSLFPLTVCKSLETEATDALATGDSAQLKKVFNKCVERVEKRGWPDPDLFMSNAIASSIAFSIISKHPQFMSEKEHQYYQAGRVIFVYGERGCGKTTLVYWSAVSPLLMAGMDLGEASRVFKALVVDSLDKYVEALEAAGELAKKGKSLPFIVVEDAGVILSKYLFRPFKSNGEFKRALEKIALLENIAREGVGATIYVATPYSLMKPIRSLAGILVEGRFIDVPKDRLLRLTIWTARHWSSMEIIDAFSTVHPPLKVPNELYSELLSRKLESRGRIISEIRRGGPGESESRGSKQLDHEEVG